MISLILDSVVSASEVVSEASESISEAISSSSEIISSSEVISSSGDIIGEITSEVSSIANEANGVVEAVKEFFNQPLVTVIISSIIIFIELIVLVSRTSFGKKKLAEMKTEVDTLTKAIDQAETQLNEVKAEAETKLTTYKAEAETQLAEAKEQLQSEATEASKTWASAKEDTDKRLSTIETSLKNIYETTRNSKMKQAIEPILEMFKDGEKKDGEES